MGRPDPTACPKCGHTQPAGRTDCEQCGIVFRKYRGRVEADPLVAASDSTEPAEVLADATQTRGGSLRELLLPAADGVNPVWFAGRVLALLGLAAWSLPFLFSTPGSGYALKSFLHGVNLLFHEAGHILFRPFGEFLSVLGGSLMQLLIPAICGIAFLWKERNAFGAAVATWWVGENLLDLAPYIADARAGALPLLGGVTGRDVPGYHDWEQILGTLGWLRHDRLIGWIAHGVGVALMVAALVWGGMVLWGQFRDLKRM